MSLSACTFVQRAEGREDTSYHDPPCPGNWDWSQSCTVTEPRRRGRSEPPRAGLSLQTAKETARGSERPGSRLWGLEGIGLEPRPHTPGSTSFLRGVPTSLCPDGAWARGPESGVSSRSWC